MNFDEMSKGLLKHGIKIGFLSKNIYRSLATQMKNETTIIAAGEGIGNSSKQPIVVTNDNIYIISHKSIMGGIDCSIIPISKVGSINVSGGILSTISIKEGTVDYQVKNIESNNAKKIASAIRERQSKEGNGGNTTKNIDSVDSIPDQIKKLSELKDLGILTEDEFNSKKKDLLSRM